MISLLEMPNFGEICRTCLITDESLLSINSIVEDSLRIDDCFRFHLNVEVSEDDRLPPNICLVCLNKLLLARKFRIQCIDSAQLLNAELKKKRANDEADSELENVPIESIEYLEIDFLDKSASIEDESRLDNDDQVGKNAAEVEIVYVGETIIKEEEPEYCSEVKITDNVDDDFVENQRTTKRNKNRIYCLQCHKTFDSTSNRKSHFNSIHAIDNDNGKCLICRKKFSSRDQLLKHLPTHRFNDKIRNHGCPHCSRTFHSKPHFLSHLRTHTGERPFSCTTCDRAFAQKSALITHMALHVGKTVPCALCDKMFSRISQLNLHMRKHNGERPYACDICPKKYRQSCHLKNHLRTHSGMKAGTCRLCGSTFTQMSSLRKHMFTHTKRPYACPKCPADFIQKWRFRKHLTKSHDIHDDPNLYKQNTIELINLNELDELGIMNNQ